MGASRFAFRLSILLLAVALALRAQAMRIQPSQNAVEAAFLTRFPRYIAWPTAAAPPTGAPFQLCVIGRDPFGRLLDRAAARELIDGHGVIIRRMMSADRVGGCNLAFVQGATMRDTARLLLALGSEPILTVTDGRAGSQRGMIHFAIVSGRVRFFIDEAAAAERGLSISSRLLALAAGVRQRR